MKTNISKKARGWKLGDVITDRLNDNFGLIVKHDDENYCVMDITPNKSGTYSNDYSDIIGDVYSTKEELKADFDKDCWTKVDAELNIKI